VDTYTGRILGTLEELGLDVNTIVVFTSDHGDMLGSHRIVYKTLMYQEAVRVPLVIRLPGQREAKRIEGPVSQIDVLPTLLDFMDWEVPSDCQGRSLRDVMESGENRIERDVFIEWHGDVHGAPKSGPDAGGGEPDFPVRVFNDPIRTIITADGWRFSCSPMGSHELFNLSQDRGERQNRAGDSAYLHLMRELKRRITVWQEKTGDRVRLPDV
jgi:arylsulfatase A-like enzyme